MDLFKFTCFHRSEPERITMWPLTCCSPVGPRVQAGRWGRSGVRAEQNLPERRRPLTCPRGTTYRRFIPDGLNHNGAFRYACFIRKNCYTSFHERSLSLREESLGLMETVNDHQLTGSFPRIGNVSLFGFSLFTL